MAMTVGEATAVSQLLRGLGVTREPRAAITAQEVARVEQAALILAAGARKRLLAGDRDSEIRAGLARFFSATAVGEAWPPRAGDTWMLHEEDSDNPEVEHASVWLAVVDDEAEVVLVEAHRQGGIGCPQQPEELRWQGRMVLAHRVGVGS